MPSPQASEPELEYLPLYPRPKAEPKQINEGALLAAVTLGALTVGLLACGLWWAAWTYVPRFFDWCGRNPDLAGPIFTLAAVAMVAILYELQGRADAHAEHLIPGQMTREQMRKLQEQR